ERAWKGVAAGGRVPAVVDHCEGFAGPERTVLFWELIELDRGYRTARGEAPLPEDYRGLCHEYDAQLSGELPQPAPMAGGGVPTWSRPELPGLRIVEVLGAGGMGVVYKAWQPSLDRYVAVKMLRNTTLAESGMRERFTREARAVAKLQHPNLVQV